MTAVCNPKIHLFAAFLLLETLRPPPRAPAFAQSAGIPKNFGSYRRKTAMSGPLAQARCQAPRRLPRSANFPRRTRRNADQQRPSAGKPPDGLVASGKLVVARIVTNDSACEALSKVGFPCTPAQVRVEARDERWVVHLPRQHLAWFASSDAGLARLKSERRLLRLLEERCSFGAPRVIFESIAGDFDVRTMVPGMAEPWKVYPEVRASRSLARQVGTAVGAILAQQHTHIRVADVAGWLPPRPSWPESAAWVCEHLLSYARRSNSLRSKQ
jgi:hypothetical protein